MAGFARGAVVLGIVLAPWLWAAAPLPGQTNPRWDPDDRVLLTSFHLVNSLTRDERRVYAATDRGLQILDMIAGRWDMPSTVEDGYPAGEGPAGLAFDPRDRRLWLGTLTGDLYSYQVDFQRWELEGSPAVGAILRLAWLQEPDGGVLYVRSPSGWYRLPPFSLFAEPVQAGQLPASLRALELGAEERLARTEPGFASARGTVLVDEDGQVWPMTDFVRGERPNVYWIGTAGDDLYAYDARFLSAEPHRFGLLTPSAGALARDGEWIWYGGDGRGQRRGVTRGRSDLQEWRFHDVRRGAPARLVDDILTTGDAVWFAARDGVYRRDRSSGSWTRSGGLAGGMAARRLARTSDGVVWAATDRGLLRVFGPEGGNVEIGLTRVSAVEAVADTLWVAGPGGVRRFLTSGQELDWPPGAGPPAAEIQDLEPGGQGMWAATTDALWRFDGATWSGPLREVALGGAGALTRIRARGDELWVAGSGGVARRSPDTGEWSYYLVGEDLPAGPVNDVLPLGDQVFVATLEGVVRLSWQERF